MQKISQTPVYVITPFHLNMAETTRIRGEMVSLGTFPLKYREELIPIEVLQLDRGVRWIFLHPSNTPAGEAAFFSGSKHPYDVGNYHQEAPATLRRDALLFGLAASEGLSVIDPASSWVVMAQDWEAASICLAEESRKPKPRPVFITLHNIYDCPAPNEALSAFGIDPRVCPGTTVLERAMPLAQREVFTVSEQYALDLTTETLPARILAPHLRELLASRLIGVNNGKFVEPSLQEELITRAKNGDHRLLAEFKTEKRMSAVSSVRKVHASESTPVWGDADRFDARDAPWFVMAGRDDPRQKGYDVFAVAIDQYLSTGGNARFLLFPIPGDEGQEGLSFLHTLAKKYPQAVLVLPFIFREGYMSALQGASFGIMPSFYEPFGMANEFYLNGTVVIGRATGGILQQVIPYRQARSFTDAVRIRADRWFPGDAHPTGLLYREPDDVTRVLEDWQKINASDDVVRKTGVDRLSSRMRTSLFRSMVDQLVQCMSDAADIYQNHPDIYYRMIAEGYLYINNNFTWESAARKYLQYLQF